MIALIPAHNEAPRIAAVIQATRAYLPVLVVDDGSSDATAQIAQEAGAAVIRQVPNQGKGMALKAGFERALAEGCDAILTLDADGQHDPSEIPTFLAAFADRGGDLIIGSRDFSKMPFSRRFANTSGRLIFSRALGHPIRDNQSGYRLVSQRLAQAALQSRQGGFEFEVDMVIICIRRSWRLDWVPIRTIYGEESSHINPLRHAGRFIRLAWQTYREVHSTHPLEK